MLFLRGLTRFFFDPDAFTFKGIMAFVLQMLGVLAVLMSLQYLSNPVTVSVENREPVSCLDLNQYEETFTLRQSPYPKKREASVKALTARHWPHEFFRVTVGPTPTRLTRDPSEFPHHILCWYAPPRSPERERYVSALRQAAMAAASDSQLLGDPRSRIERARRIARSEEAPSNAIERRELDAANALGQLESFSSAAARLDLHAVMKSSDSRSVYATAAGWKDNVIVAEIPGVDSLIGVIESAGLDPLELAIALEEIEDARWFINWLEVSNRSSHAVAEGATVSVNHSGRGLIEFLGGAIDFTQRQQRFVARVEKLLPRETRWAVLRTRRPLVRSEIELIADPTPFFDRSNLQLFLPVVVAVACLWGLGNWLGRRARPKC